MKIYLAGPMTGHPNHNFPAFFVAAALLRMKGHDVINPAELDIADGHANWNPVEERIVLSPTFTKHDAIRRDFLAMCQDREAIVLLEGWETSEGANDELHLARRIKLKEFAYAGHGDIVPLDVGGRDVSPLDPTQRGRLLVE